jgi:hypothetical protein
LLQGAGKCQEAFKTSLLKSENISLTFEVKVKGELVFGDCPKGHYEFRIRNEFGRINLTGKREHD